jgi:membrane protease subunit (stomatin/prohibitin family)
MAIWNMLSGEFIDIIEWVDDTRDTMVWRYPDRDREIKQGAKLIVRETQVAAFINEGTLADLFLFPGTFTLETRNLPVLAKLRGWKYGFESPFKSDVYFVSTRVFTDRKWGTKNPIMLRDPEFGPVRLRAFGSFAIKVSDPATFLKTIVGTSHRFSVEQIGEQLRDMVVSRFADVLGESRIPVLDLASNYDELGKFLTDRIAPDFEPFGLQMVRLYVENISLPEQVEKALDQRTSMGVIGDLQKYTQYQTATAIGDAARNPGGLAGAGAGMGAGFAMANQMGQAMGQLGQQPQSVPAQGGPPPLPGAETFYVAINGQQQGPFGIDALRQKAQQGQIGRGTLVWRNGMPSWAALEGVPELAPVIANVPPPLPPPQS